MIRGKYLSTVVDSMQKSLSVAENWCKTKGPSINLEKTEVVVFKRKRKTERLVKHKYQDVKLNLSNKIKYLGIILSEKLMWKAHVKTQVKKVLKAL